MPKSVGLRLKKIAVAVNLITLACFAGNALADVIYYEANDSNSSNYTIGLGNSTLGNGVLSNPSGLTLGNNQYSYAAVTFTPTQDGTYSFGQIYSPLDTVMILYDNVFDPTAPGNGALVGNDDTNGAIHQNTLGDPNANIWCGSANYCPQITFSVTAGQTYTLFVSHYSPSAISNFEYPFTFYSTGDVVFNTYSGRSPIDMMADYYLASELGITVDPIFVGGTLRMDQVNAVYLDDFTLSNMATNTIDQYGNNSIFSGVISDAISGSGGQIIIDNSLTDGSITFSGDNTYSGSTTLKGGILSVSKDANLGDSSATLIIDGGTLRTTDSFVSARDIILASTGAVHVSGSTTLTLTGAMSGTGSWTKEGAGTLVLNGNNANAGSTVVEGGMLIVGDGGASLVSSGGSSLTSSDITVAANAVFGGYGSSTGDIYNNGIIAIGSSINSASNGSLANFVVNGDMANNNMILLSGRTAGDVLTINGDYAGNSGSLILNTVLGDDTSVTDKLVINGDATGTTYVTINNLGGAGAQVIEGIEVVYVGGASTSDAFVQNGRIVAGAYEYSLVQGNASGTDTQSWFLASSSILRPEVGGYVGLFELNNGAFDHSFHDRQQLLDNEYQSSWARLEYTRSKSKAGSGNQLTNKADRTLLHIGSDIYQNEALHLGFMAGYSKGDVDTDSNRNSFKTNSKSDGYSLGLYGTWFDQDNAEGGLYLDSYVQYNWFRNEVNGSSLGREKFNSHSMTLSAEAGYGFVLGSTNETSWLLEPQAQLIYSNYGGNNHTERNGTRISSNQSDTVTGRIGLRLQGKNDSVQPFVTLNYWVNSNQASVTMDNETVQSNRARNLFEVKIGGQVKLSENVHLFGQLQDSFGSDSTHNYGGNIGVKVNW